MPRPDLQPLIRRLYGYVAYRIGDGPDPENVTSETFERRSGIGTATTRVAASRPPGSGKA